MNHHLPSKPYAVIRADESHYPDIYNLCKSNTKYYEYIHSDLSMESIKDDLMGLPPNKSEEDKFFLCFYDEGTLVAIMDLIHHYPTDGTAYIGLFMVDQTKQNTGIGTSIFREVESTLKDEGFKWLQLAYVEENKEAELFWKKNGFQCKGNPVQAENYVAVPMLKALVKE